SSAIYDQTSVDIEAKAPAGSPSGMSAPNDNAYMLRASGRILKFDGWLGVYAKTTQEELDEKPSELAGEEDEQEPPADGELPAKKTGREEKEDEAELPPLEEGETLNLVEPPGVLAEQKFTQPPPRYNEGSLVRALEERG